MNPHSKTDAAIRCLTDAQTHLNEALVQMIIGAEDHTDARNVLHLAGHIQKIQRNISAVLKDIYRLTE